MPNLTLSNRIWAANLPVNCQFRYFLPHHPNSGDHVSELLKKYITNKKKLNENTEVMCSRYIFIFNITIKQSSKYGVVLLFFFCTVTLLGIGRIAFVYYVEDSPYPRIDRENCSSF